MSSPNCHFRFPNFVIEKVKLKKTKDLYKVVGNVVSTLN